MRLLHVIRRQILLASMLAALCSSTLSAQKMAFNPISSPDSTKIDTTSKAVCTEEDKQTLVEKIDNFAAKNNVFSKLLRQVWVFNREDDGKKIVSTQSVPSEKSQNYEGRIIRDIHIKVLDAFGYTVNDPVCYDVTLLENVGNHIHYPTRQWIIKNRLLFNRGDTLNMLDITESERLIRANESITDAKIYIVPVPGNSDSVDITVYAQDVWNLGANVKGNPLKRSGTVEITDINFIGLGHKVSNRITYDQNFTGKWQYSGNYYVPEILNTYISSGVHYNTQGFKNNYGIGFNRGFFSSTTRLAGGMFYDFSQDKYFISAPDTSFSGVYKKLYQDLWAGYALNRGDKPLIKGVKGQFIVSGRVITNYFTNQDFIPKAVFDQYQDQNLVLASVGFSNREYYKDKFLYGFGRTEDIPTGYLLTYTAGVDTRQLFSRFYNGTQIAFGSHSKRIGYTGCSMELGSFMGRGKIEEGVARAQVFYFTDLIDLGEWHLRHFLSNTLTLGINRSAGESIGISSDLKGFNAPISGTQKFVTNYEADFYMPFNWLGFRPIGMFFFDMGLIGNDQHSMVRSRLHKGIGLGLRVKNEHLIFSAIQISFHYYPGISDYGGHPFAFQQSGPPNRFQSFQFLTPSIIPYY